MYIGVRRLLALGICLAVAAVSPGSDVEALLQAYQGAASPEARSAALQDILKDYPSFKHHVAQKLESGSMTPEFRTLTRDIDEHVVGMTQQTWRDVLRSDPNGVTHVVPVGSLGDRLTNPAYIPGKSDKDMIPMGPHAAESVNKFRQAFVQRFGITPEKLDINVLDPTNPSSWPGRVEALSNPEKYNTLGGNNWLQRSTYDRNPTVWQFEPLTGKVNESDFRSLFPKGSEPPPLNAKDAAGFFSDNTRFRTELATKYADPAELMLKQSKYDLRNAAAYGLAGGKLTAEEQALMQAASLARQGKVDEAVQRYAAAIGAEASTEVGRQAAMKAYLEGMDALTAKMAEKVVATHLDEIAKAGGRSGSLVTELAGVLHNLPPATRDAVVKELGRDVARADTLRLANQVADQLGKDVFIRTAFDEAATKLFGRPYDKLTPAEKLLVHNAGEESASALSKFGKGAGLTLSGAAAVYSAYEAYCSEAAQRGAGIGAMAAAGRGVLDLIELGYPPLQAAELVARGAALGIRYGIDGYKMDTLDKLYEQYKRSGNLDDVLNDAEFTKYFAGGLRQFRSELREAAAREGKNLTGEQLDKAIRDYFVNRAAIEKEGERVQKDLAWAQAFVNSRHIPLVPGASSDLENSRLSEQEMNAALAQLLLIKMGFEQKLRADGVPFTNQDIASLLFLSYRGTAEEVEAALNRLYRNAGKSYPPAAKVSQPLATTTDVRDGRTSATPSPKDGLQIIHSVDAQVARGPRSESPCRPGVLLSGGGSFTESRVDKPCDPPVELGSTEVECAGELLVVVTVDQPVPRRWSLYNSNTHVRVIYEPRNAGKLGRVQELGNVGPGQDEKEASVTLTLPGPGRITATAGAPSGSGPLTGSCFSQSFTARVELAKAADEVPAAFVSHVQAGDVIRTKGPRSAVVLASQQGERIALGGESQSVRVSEDGGAVRQLVVEQAAPGSQMRYIHHETAAPGPETRLRDGSAVITPQGTEIVLSHERATTNVIVLEGAARIDGDDGFTTTVLAGYAFDLSQRREQPLDRGSMRELAIDGLNADQMPAEPVAAGSGDVGAWVANRGVEPEWTIVDANRDANISRDQESTSTVCITVPSDNLLDRRTATAPMLLHAVKGDFDLDGTVDAVTTATDNALAHLVVHRPGGFVGLHNGQRDADTYAAHFWTLGGLQLINGRWELTTLSGEGQRSNFETSPSGVRLRLARRGNLWKSYASVDNGFSWHLLTRAVMECDSDVYVGWVFQRAAYDRLQDVPAHFRLRDVRLRWAPPATMPVDDWDVCAPWGAASTGDEGLVATVPASSRAVSRIESGAPIEGDFDLVAGYDILAWRRAPYEASSFSFYVCDTQHRNFAYIGRSGSPQNASRLQTDLRQDEGWNRGYQWVESQARTGRLRIRRIGWEITTSFWNRDHWERLDRGFNGGWDTPVFVGLMVSNEEDRALPGDTSVRLRLIRTNEATPEANVPDSALADAVELTPAAIPTELALPAGWMAAMVELPFKLGTLFPSPGGGVYVFSNERDVARCFRLTDDLKVSDSFTTDLVAGVNRKAGIASGNNLWVAVDAWGDGGNRYGGLFEIDRSGRWKRVIDAAASLDNLGAMVSKGGRSLLLADFGCGGVFEYRPADNRLVPLLPWSRELHGVVSIAADQARQLLVAATAKSYGAEHSGLYTMDMRANPLVPKMVIEGKDNVEFSAVVWDKTAAAGNAVILAVASENVLWRVDLASGRATSLVTGIAAPTAVRWSGNTLWALCGERNILRITPAPADISSATQPSRENVGTVSTPVTEAAELPTGENQSVAGQQAPLPTQSGDEQTPAPTPSASSAQAPEGAKPSERLILRAPSESVALGTDYPTADFELEFGLVCLTPGTVLDTVGINAAPRGSWSLAVEPAGTITFSVYDPRAASRVKIANGWHVLRSRTAVPQGTEATVRVVRSRNGLYQLFVNDSLEAQAIIPVTLSGKPLYVGDYPADAQWAPRFPTNRGFVGSFELYYFGPRRAAARSGEARR
jgi:hypothetical protein